MPSPCHSDPRPTQLTQGCDNMMTSCQKMAVIIQAASEGDYKVIRQAIKSSTPGLRLNKTMSEALVIAAAKGHFLVIRELLHRHGLGLEEYYEGKTALLAAAESGHEHIVEELHLAGADLEAKAYEDGPMNGSTALVLAAAFNHRSVVQYAINAGANKEARNSQGETALIVASRLGNHNMATFLGCNNANLEATDRKGKTALLKAIQQNDLDMVKCLCLVGANPKTRDLKNHTPMMTAAALGHLEIIGCLKSAGARPNEGILTTSRRRGGGGTPLTEAISHRQFKAAEKLLSIGSKVSFHLAFAAQRIYQCRRHCHVTCPHGSYTDVVQYLLASVWNGEEFALHCSSSPRLTSLTPGEILNEMAKLVPEILEDSLQSRCRMNVRRVLRKFCKQPLERSVKMLGLPELIQKYLLFNVDVEKITSK